MTDTSLHPTHNQAGLAYGRGQPFHVETPHYVIRSLRAADMTEEVVAWFNNPAMLAGLNLQALNFSLDGLRAFIASFDNRENYFLGIFERETGQLLGFYNFAMDLEHQTGTLNLGILPELKIGGPILWPTVEVVLEEFFQHRNVEKIKGMVLGSNRRMLFTLLMNKHFVHELTLKQECQGIDGKRHDLLVFSCFKDASTRPQPVNPMPSFIKR